MKPKRVYIRYSLLKLKQLGLSPQRAMGRCWFKDDRGCMIRAKIKGGTIVHRNSGN